MSARRVTRAAGRLLPAALLLLAGCSASGVQEVRDWMAAVKRQTPVKVTPLPEPKKFIPFGYGASAEPDPFNANKLLIELAKAANKQNNGLMPDTKRRKEVLEAFPLDTLRMVGMMEKTGLRVAILQVDKAVFQVRAGNYIGQNFGHVTGVTENAVLITETVQDAAGEWVERKAKLELQENKK